MTPLVRLLALGLCFTLAAGAANAEARAPRAKAFPAVAALECDVRAFGAMPDDEIADTAAIQAAIAACADRGGRVILGKGRWLSGGLQLGSHMTFHLAPGAVLAAIPDITLFPERVDAAVQTDDPQAADAYPTYRAFLYAPQAQNLTIEGPGVLNGQGEKFWDKDFYKLSIPRPTLPRPQQMMELVDCANVTVRNITLVEAPAYSVRFYRCNGVRAENVTVRNDPRSPNTDGIQIRDTSNAFIRGADINTGDDAIVVKSYDRMVENLVVTDSILVSDDAAIKFGTAGHKGVRNSLFANIVIRDSRYGIALFQMDGGAYLNNRFTNLTIETGGRGPNHFAVYADIDRRRAESPLGRIEGLTLTNVEVRTAGNILISGQPDAPIRDLSLTNLRVRTPEAAQSLAPPRRKPRGNAFVPPTGKTEDHAAVAASVTIANTERLAVENLDVAHADPKAARAGLALVNVRDGVVDGVRLSNAHTGAASSPEPAVRVRGGADLAFARVRATPDVATLLAVEGLVQGGLSTSELDMTGRPKAIVRTETKPAPRQGARAGGER